MKSRSGIDIVLGTGNVGDSSIDPFVRYDRPEDVAAYLDTFHERGGNIIDTARGYTPHAYHSSEPRLGLAKAADRFTIDSKVQSYPPGAHRPRAVEKSIDDSLRDLGVDRVNIMYLHFPDPDVPLEEVCGAMDKAYRGGKFKKFGLSSYSAAQVEEIVAICDKNGWVKPTAYQGHYNPIGREFEASLFPVLRKYGMAFYAYSPSAAGFFAGALKDPKPGSRWDTTTMIGRFYTAYYKKESFFAAADRVTTLAASHNISGHAAALRWTIYHSRLDAKHGDGVVIAASNLDQLRENLDSIDAGPLPDDLVVVLDAVYPEIAQEITVFAAED